MPRKEIRWNHIKCSAKSRKSKKKKKMRSRIDQKSKCNEEKIFTNRVSINPIISINTLKVNNLNTQLKRHSVE